MKISSSIAPAVLEHLIPLRELTAEALEALAQEAEVEEYPADSVIFRQGERDRWTRYLLSGSLMLTGGDAGHRTLLGTGDFGVAVEPIGLRDVHDENAITSTPARVLRLPSARIRQLLADCRLPEYRVEAVAEEEAPTGVQLFYRLFEDLREDRLSLPSMPDIALRVREAVKEEDIAAGELARIIQNDPAVAARVVRAANAAAYAGQAQVDSLTAAILRLGHKVTRDLVTAVTLREVFHSVNPMLNKRMLELWRHSTLVAATSAVLARKLAGFASERALLAGLVHDIGVVPMLAHAGSYPKLVRNPALLEATLREFRGQVGGMILRRWGFSESLAAVPVYAEDWWRAHHGAPDYADLVMAAQLQTAAAG
ncbi:HDOD domain-containing protein [Alkalilimnicola ehrlichii]|uniref:HDOD domain-containing protein n=1 Tax=Alkalilimnicola ehrlichii TaxID=351052 RepID=UPI0015F251C1|nr:HDOD domain-containing protein [Alkalilimnicola ehrlichii]